MVERPKHPLEAEVIACLENDQEVSVARLGGVDKIAAAADRLAGSPVMPELLKVLLQHWPHANDDQQVSIVDTICRLLDWASLDFALAEGIDFLDQWQPRPMGADERIFGVLLKKCDRDAGRSALLRSTALEGAFRWSISNRRWQLRFLDFLLGVSIEDDPVFLKHAAKIMGVAYSHWREQELVAKLEALAKVPEARLEAAFEYGMAKLVEALDAKSHPEALAAFRIARDWFELSAAAAETNPEAELYRSCIELLMAFEDGADRSELKLAGERVREYGFELSAWHLDERGPSWLGARRTEGVCWSVLTSRLVDLTAHLDEASWWEPVVVIEECVLAAYNAGRSILRRNDAGNIEAMLRPRIAAAMAEREGQAHHLKTWLTRNMEHEWADGAKELIRNIDELVAGTRGTPNPPGAAIGEPTIAALIERADIPPEVKARLGRVVVDAVLIQMRNLTAAECEIIETATTFVSDHTDYRHNRNGQVLFHTLLVWIVRFLSIRLEITKGDDPTAAYLFETDPSNLPHEDRLQADFFRYLAPNAAGSDLEVTNIGGGRADIRLKSGSERIVVEVKRELRDSSFESIAASYAAQTTEYQNVSIRLGFLLVLDLTEGNLAGSPHITSLVETREVQRASEGLPRIVTIVKVPGRRNSPSALSKKALAARAAKTPRRKHQPTAS